MDYKKYELKEKRGIRWVNLDKNKALTGIQMRYKATTTNEQSAFKGYVNSFAITNVRVRGIKALQYLKYQDLRLKEYLMKHKGMKVILQVSATMKSKKTNEEIRESIRSRRYNITNEEEIPQKLNQMATDIEFQLDKMEMSESGLVSDKLKSNITNTILLVEVHTLNYLISCTLSVTGSRNVGKLDIKHVIPRWGSMTLTFDGQAKNHWSFCT